LVILFVTSGILVSIFYNFDWKQLPSLGLEPGVNASAQFFKLAAIQGPIFNDYDIGGYLIFHLSPQYKLFVDDRKEAYPNFFFREIYIPIQLNDAYWGKMQSQFHFNVIFLNRKTNTTSEREFVMRRLNDPSWATVFIDQYAIILLNRNHQNAPLISRYELHVHKIRMPDNSWGYKLEK